MKKQEKELHWYKRLSEEEMRSGKENNLSREIIVNLEKYLMDAYQWINEISALMKVDERKDIAWSALRGVLHAIRDCLTPEEVFHLSAQLPLLIRGLYFEGYQIANKPEKFHLIEMERRITDSFRPVTDIDAKLAFKSVLLVLYNHISEGELHDIYVSMPKDIREMWDDCLKIYAV